MNKNDAELNQNNQNPKNFNCDTDIKKCLIQA